jgi:hypothetical protein
LFGKLNNHGHLWKRYSGTVNQVMKVTIKDLCTRNPWSGTFLLAATLYQGNEDKNHKIWNMVSTDSSKVDIYISCINGKFTMGKLT